MFEQLDTPFVDLIPGSDNQETVLEFIRNSEEEFCMRHVDLNSMTEKALNEYISFLDDLWNK